MRNTDVIDLPAASEGVRHVRIGQPATGAGMTIFWNDWRPVGHRLTASDGQVHETLAVSAIEPPPPQLRNALTVSVIICTRDRPEELARCLRSLPQQTYKVAEIIVVDNGSKDSRTREAAEAAGAIYLREDRTGLDFARNAGARRAAGDIVAYTDDDVILDPHWLEYLVAGFDAPEIGAVTGLVLPAELATEAQLHFETYWSFGQGYDRKDFTPAAFRGDLRHVFPAWKIGAGASMAFRRGVFERAGYFDERLDVGRAGCSGDSEYWYRLLASGYACRYQPAAVAFHFHRRSMEGLAGQIFHYMRGHSAALMVQYQRTGLRANLKLALIWKPRYYLSRYIEQRRRPAAPEFRFMREEITGYISGLWFFLRHPRESRHD